MSDHPAFAVNQTGGQQPPTPQSQVMMNPPVASATGPPTSGNSAHSNGIVSAASSIASASTSSTGVVVTPTVNPVVVPPGAPKRKELHDTVLLVQTPDQETEQGIKRNPEAAAIIREDWIFKQVRSRVDEFTNYNKATLFVGTWNVNAKGKEEEPLEPWLCADWGPSGEYAPDVVAVGFQEIVDLNAINVAVDNKTQQKSQFWAEKLQQTLNKFSDPNRSYYMVSQKALVGLLICVFVKQSHRLRVKDVTATSVGVGVMGIAGNKGGVSVRLQFYDTTLCFICSHLAAHRENVTGRNSDFANIYSKTIFDVGEQAIRDLRRSGNLAEGVVGHGSVGVKSHDVVFWLGDLNYRIDESMPTEVVLKNSESGGIGELRSLDQLNIERSAGRVFQEFEEGVLNFPPTYKYQPGTDMYEQRPEKKLRAPAWCDRILWRAQVPSHVEQFTYNRSIRPNVSDHKAVYSTLRVTVKDVVREKREAIYKELLSLLDRYDNQTQPSIGLDRVNLDFGLVRYEQSISLPIKITNTGSVVAQYRLSPRLDEKVACKPFLSITPTVGMLIPGEEPATMNFTLTVDRVTAQALNSGRESLEDIIILSLEGGRDYYITVKAQYAISCFGMSIDELVRHTEPIRSVPLDLIHRAERADSNSPPLCIPKELWRLVDAIYEKGLDSPYLFTDAGVPSEISQIRECLDTGSNFGQFKIHSYAEALTSFLSSLSSPIIPLSLFPTIEVDSQNIQALARRVIEELPPIHYNVFIYIVSFFREILLYRQKNHLTAAKLARVLTDSVTPGQGNVPEQRKMGMQLILLHLLETSSI